MPSSFPPARPRLTAHGPGPGGLTSLRRARARSLRRESARIRLVCGKPNGRAGVRPTRGVSRSDYRGKLCDAQPRVDVKEPWVSLKSRATWRTR